MSKTRNIIVLSGIPGSGKSTLRKFICSEFKYSYISTDEIKEQKQITTLSLLYELRKNKLYELMDSNKNIILDNNTDKQYFRDEIEINAKTFEYNVIYIHLTAPFLLLFARQIKRRVYNQKHYNGLKEMIRYKREYESQKNVIYINTFFSKKRNQEKIKILLRGE